MQIDLDVCKNNESAARNNWRKNFFYFERAEGRGDARTKRREVVNEAADLITSPEFREDPVDLETSNA